MFPFRCIKVAQKISSDDKALLDAAFNEYEENGVDGDDAAAQATQDVLSQLEAERQDYVDLINKTYPGVLEEPKTQDVPEYADATKRKQFTKLGENSKGFEVYKDDNGVRSYVESGIRIAQSVSMVPTTAGMGMEFADVAELYESIFNRAYLTVNEVAEFAADRAKQDLLQPEITVRPAVEPPNKPDVFTIIPDKGR